MNITWEIYGRTLKRDIIWETWLHKKIIPHHINIKTDLHKEYENDNCIQER